MLKRLTPEAIASLTDETVEDYLPEVEEFPLLRASAHGLYRCRRELGDTPNEALRFVLEGMVRPLSRPEEAREHGD